MKIEYILVAKRCMVGGVDMAKRVRFRDVKKGKVPNLEELKSKKDKKKQLLYPSAGTRIKAFITDSFMILMPIMYAVFYLVMGGREGFAENKLLGWIYILVPYIIITTIFIAKTGQTPGMKAYNIKVVTSDGKKLTSVTRIIIRQILAVIDFLLFSWIVIYFRKDKKTLHEILTDTKMVIEEDDK